MRSTISKKISNRNTRITEHPILRFERKKKVRFFFEGKPLYGYETETIAAALVANGIRVFRHTDKLHRPRGFFCAVGKCSSCLMIVDGKPNTMVCMEPLRPGVKVKRQEGRGKL
ncbi:pyridine nucleotide-disulfide oxidoreductase [candidate division WOR-3 bacterium JGI_Cruoil_03_51_56]|uniref:Pyridine nucleotide-disulfide oxidoreductase n=1 Tax=candidate division WOR-3 bacterium JGI_Cruoil_03_51_56 TaxID=1973747 RepID=A0A235BXE0_UNCW3|nr:MAG: pyridine nucleotide-disulfide oxidoreductase [candidate division WOR-3 bacterium JGI_Cruoil_03_51_56]